MVVIDYSVAGRWKDVVRALAMHESNENADAIGDGGQAFGILQQHPAFFSEYYGRAHLFPADVHDTWIAAQSKAAAAYLEIWHDVGRDLLIQGYNKGINGVMRLKDPERAPDYLAGWRAAFEKIRGVWPS